MNNQIEEIAVYASRTINHTGSETSRRTFGDAERTIRATFGRSNQRRDAIRHSSGGAR